MPETQYKFDYITQLDDKYQNLKSNSYPPSELVTNSYNNFKNTYI